MDPILDTFEKMADGVAFRRPRIRWISTVTGTDMSEAPDARYWRDQIRRPVRFHAAVEGAIRSPATCLEVGPGTTLIGLGRRCVKPTGPQERGVAWIRSLTQEEGDWTSLLSAVRRLYLRGCTIQWDALEPPGSRRVSLPTYPFQEQRWWLDPEDPGPSASDSLHVERHPLLGERLGGGDPVFEALLTFEQYPFLKDHRVFGRVILPTTVALESVVAAAVQGLGYSRPVISDFLYERALAIAPDEPVWLHLELVPDGSRATFRLQSTGIDDAAPWRLHISGTVRDHANSAGLPPFPSHELRSCQEIPPDRFYGFLARRGLGYGAVFRGIVGLWLAKDGAFAKVALPPEASSEDYLLHPAFLDACLHVYAATVRKHGSFDEDGGAEARTYVPTGMESFQLHRAGVRAGWVQAVVVEREGEGETRLKLDIRVYELDGRPVASYGGVTVRETTAELFAPEDNPKPDEFLYGMEWQVVSQRAAAAPFPKNWCILGDANGVGDHLAERLRAAGSTAVVVTPETLAGMTTNGGSAQDPVDPSRFRTLLQKIEKDSVGLVNLWPLRCVPTGDLSDGPPTSDTMALSLGACLGLVKALEGERYRTPPRLWIVTRGAQADGTEKTLMDVAQSPMRGLGRTVALEHPEMWGGLIDLPTNTDAQTAGDLLFGEARGVGPKTRSCCGTASVWRRGSLPFSPSSGRAGRVSGMTRAIGLSEGWAELASRLLRPW
jgi:acyl transferase domain-containing protein